MKKKFLYLVHGNDKLIRNYDFLADRPDADLVQSTYNAPADGAHYFPGSTWAEGRNGLLEKALELENSYEYYIFMDDDIEFHKGGYDELEEQLIRLKPAVAVPVFVPKTTRTVLGLGISYHRRPFIPLSSYQVCKFADGQFMAFHEDVIRDRVLMPLQNQFDEISWWYTSSNQQILMHNLYPNSTLQLNNVAITNESHREYTKNSFDKKQEAWLKEQFIGPVINPREYAANLLSVEGIRYAYSKFGLKRLSVVIKVFIETVIGTIRYKSKERHLLDRRELKKIFRKGSEIYRQVFNDDRS
jgi:hypothetical protein